MKRSESITKSFIAIMLCLILVAGSGNMAFAQETKAIINEEIVQDNLIQEEDQAEPQEEHQKEFILDGITYHLDDKQQTATVVLIDVENHSKQLGYEEGSVVIPEEVLNNDWVYTVKRISNTALAASGNLKNIVIPDSVEELKEEIFQNSELAVIYCNIGSAAEAYAVNHNIVYKTQGLQVEENSLSVGESLEMVLVSSLEFLNGKYDLQWTSSNEEIGHISEEGVLTGLSSGNVVINVKVAGLIASYEINVLEESVSEELTDELNLIDEVDEVDEVIGQEQPIERNATSLDEYSYYEENGWKIRDDGMLVGYSVKAGLSNVVIPDTVAGITVKGIGDGLYLSVVVLRKVTIPDTVEYIGSNAFYNTGLTEIELPKSLKYLGTGAFWNTGISGTVRIPKGVLTIEGGSFKNCGNITEVIIEGLVTSIGNDAFINCTSLVDMELPEELQTIGSGAFYNCENYSPVLPRNITGVGSAAFYNTKIKEVYLSSDITVIEKAVFAECDELVKVDISPVIIKEAAFYNCSKLQQVSLGTKLETMNYWQDFEGKLLYGSFENCKSLTDIMLPDTTERINGRAFQNAGLTTITIPKNVYTIGRAFDGCNQLEEILVAEENKFYTSIDGVLYNRYEYYDSMSQYDGTLSLERYPEGKKDTSAFYVLSNVRGFAASAFFQCELSQIILENNDVFSWNVNFLDDKIGGFEGLTHLTALKVDESISFMYENDDNLYPDFAETSKFTIYGIKGSSAELYANEYGYPFRDASDFEYILDNVPDDQFQVQVLSEEGFPLSGISISITGIEEQTTETNGIAKFTDSNLKEERAREITIFGVGYRTKTIRRNSGFGIGICIILKRGDGKPYVQSVLLDDETDLLSQKMVLSHSEQAGTQNKIVITADFGEGTEKLYELLQGDKVVASSSNGTINIDLKNKLKASQPAYIRVCNSNSEYSDPELLSLTMVDSKFFDSITQNNGQKITIGSDMDEPIASEVLTDKPITEALLNGTNIKQSLANDFPIEMEVTQEGKIRVAINKKSSVGMNDFEGSYKKASKLKNILSGDLADIYMGKALGDFAVSGELIGYGEGYINTNSTDSENQEICFTVGLIAKLEGEGSVKYHIASGAVPLYITGGYKVGAELNGSAITGTVTKRGIEINNYANTSFKMYDNVSIGGGVGYYKALSAGVKGGVSLEGTYYLGTQQINIAARPKLELEAYVAGFKIDHELINLVAPINSWSIYTGNKIARSSTYTEATDDIEEIPRDYLDSYAITTTSEGTTIEGVYPNAQPKQISCGGKTYMFWLEDDTSRTSINRSRLVYAQVNDNRTLGDIKAVKDDGTGDFEFEIAADGEQIYVVWQDSASVFDSEVSIEEQLNDLELSVGKYNLVTEQWSYCGLTENTAHTNFGPKIIVYENSINIGWDTLDSSEFFSEDAQPQVCFEELSKNLERAGAASVSVEGLIMSTALGTFDGEKVLVYVVDTDRDINTGEDRKIIILNADDTENILRTIEAEANMVQIACINGAETLFWNTDEGVYYTESKGENIHKIDNILLSGNNQFAVTGGTGNSYIYYQLAEVNGDTTIYTIYLSEYNGAAWSMPIAIYSSENPLTSICLSEQADGKKIISFLEKNGDITTLQTKMAEEISLLQIEECTINENDAVYGNPVELSLQLRNLGLADIEGIKIEVMRGDAVIYNHSIEEVNLTSQEKRTVLLDDFVIPADIASPEELKIRVSTSREVKEKSIIVGYTDIFVKTENYFENGSNCMNVTVMNNSLMPTNVKLSVYRVEDAQNPIYEKEIKELSKDEPLNISCDVAAWEKEYQLTSVYVKVEAEKSEENLADNEALVVFNVSPQESSVKKVTLNETSLIMYAGEEIQLIPQLTPVSNEDVVFEWKSSNTNILEVSEDGIVKPLSKGNARVTCSYGDLTATCFVYIKQGNDYEIVTKVKDWTQLESQHRYSRGLNKTWVYTDESKASLALQFDTSSGLSNENDYLYIMDGEDNQIACYDGTQKLSGLRVNIPDNTVKIKLVTDEDSYMDYGFKVIDMGDYIEDNCIYSIVRTLDEFESLRPYYYEYEHGWIYQDEEAKSIRLKFGEESTMPWSWYGADGLKVYNGNGELIKEFTGTFSDEEIIVSGNTVKMKLRMGSSGNSYGFKISELQTFDEAVINGGTCGNNLTWLLSTDGTLKINGSGKINDWTRSDSAPWKTYQDQIKRIIVAEGITAIGDYSFSSCYEAKEIILPSTIQTIGEWAFEHCWQLEELNLPDSVVSLGEDSFYRCEKLQKIELPNGIEKIPDYAFSGCKELKVISWSDSLKEIGYMAFSSCESLEWLELPDSVKRIDDYAFLWCYDLEDVVIPDSVVGFGEVIFYPYSYYTAFHVNEGSKADEYLQENGWSHYISYKNMQKPEITSSSSWGFNCIELGWTRISGAAGYEIYRLTEGNYELVGTVGKYESWYDDIHMFNTEGDYTYKIRAYKTVGGETMYSEYSDENSVMYSNPDVKWIYVDPIKSINYNILQLSWVEVEYASGYEIYRSTSTGGEYSKIATIKKGSTTSYNDNFDIETGTTYYYKIKAFYESETITYGAASDVISGKTTLLATSVTLASADYNAVDISWKAVDGAQGYVISCSAGTSGSYNTIEIITSGNTTSFKNTGLTAGTAYYYRIRAYRTVNGVKVYSSYSEGQSVKPIPKQPTVSASSVSYNGIKLTWNKINGANGYVIYRATSSNGTFTAIKTITSGAIISYTNTGVGSGTTYYYKIRAYRTVSGAKVYGSYSSAKTGKAVPAKPTISTKTAGYNSVTVSWKKVAGATGYVIYCSTSSAGTYSAVKTITSGSTIKYKNTGLTSGKTYYYKVRAYRTVKGTRIYSGYSSSKSGKPIPATTKISSIKNSTAKTLQLKWSKVAGATGYEIYRATSMKGTYKKIKTITKGTEVTYRNTGLVKGKMYYYKIRAYRTVNGKKVYGNYSAIVSKNSC